MRNRVQNQVRNRKRNSNCNSNRNSNAIIRRAIFALLGFVMLTMSACNRHSEHWEALSSVENFIEEQPDSALVVLQGIDASTLSSAEERAKHALLLSMALDKNYIDKTDFEVLQPAIDYYEDNGSATDKLRTNYYQGRICQNAGNDALAMESFVNAICKGNESEDALTKARTFFAQSTIYYSLYEWDNFIETNKNAASYFKQAERVNSYANCLVRIINGYTLKDEPENAIPYIEECRQILNSVSDKILGDFYATYITYLTYYSSEQEITKAISEYTNIIPSSRVDCTVVANAYMKLQNYNEAFSVLSQYKTGNDNKKDRKYLSLISAIYKNLGDHQRALDTYEQYLALSDSIDYAIYTQDTKFVEERHNLELQNIKERDAKNRLILWAAIFIAVLLAIIVYIRYSLKINQMDKVLAEQQSEKYRLLYLQMEEERDNPTNLLAESDELAPDIKTAIGKRLELLNKFFISHITGTASANKKAVEELESLVANKEAFIESTRLTIEGINPEFITALKHQGLTDEEIDICCLYAIGLKGKDIKAYTSQPRHYNQSADIRHKLGLIESDTNLSIYLREMHEK